jgi:outer membrane protein
VKRLTAVLTFLLGTMAALPLSAQSQNGPVAGQSQSGPATPSAAQPQTQTGIPLTLAQAEATALKKNPQITVGRLNALVAWQYVREARSALLPTAAASLTAVDAEAGSRITAGALNNPIVFPRAAAGVTVSQLITDFGRTTNLLGGSQFRAKAEDKNAAATAADILLAVDQAFYNSLETKELVTVAQQTVNARQASVDKIQALTSAKLKSDVDLSFAKVDLARAKLLLLEAQNNYQSSLASLSAILGYEDQQNFQLIDESKQLTPPAPDVQPLIAQALQQRPEIAALQFQVQASAKNASAEHDLWRPTISALGVTGIAPVRDDHITPNWYGAVGANVNIPLFNGFLYSARAKAADLETEAKRQRLMNLRNDLARDVRIAWEQTKQAYERLAVTQLLQEQANLALDLAQQRYNLGLGSIVELSQAELGKTEADIADTDALYQYHLTQIVLAYTIASPK